MAYDALVSEPKQDTKPDGEECTDCVTTSERALAALGFALGVLIILMAIDLGTGGWISRLLPARAPAEG